MAIARCKECGKPTQNVKPPDYSPTPYLPMGHPHSGVICGKPDCENPGLIWRSSTRNGITSMDSVSLQSARKRQR
jgi:hypothetical protein